VNCDLSGALVDMDSDSDRRGSIRRRWPYAEVAELASRQHTIVTNEALRRLGLDRRTITRALVRGQIFQVHRGVYSLVPAQARPALAAEQAALLACGPTAVLSHHTAARLHGLRIRPTRAIHVTLVATSRHRRSHPGLHVHRTQTLHPGEEKRVSRLAVTGLARTLIDIAPLISGPELEHVLDQALRKTSAAAIHSALDHHPRRPGTPRLRALLDPERPSADTWSRSEQRLRRLIQRAGLPSPESNVQLGRDGYVPDLLWRDARVIVEYDSWEFHSSRSAFVSDRERHNQLTADGFQVLHVTWQALTDRPEKVLVWIAVALTRAGARADARPEAG
jgi:predicted transcriptional regulator of viral defense system/very-short-patch-repair endonuclease